MKLKHETIVIITLITCTLKATTANHLHAAMGHMLRACQLDESPVTVTASCLYKAAVLSGVQLVMQFPL